MAELAYVNNPKSLFRKYAKLVTWFSRTQLGRDYLSHKNFSLPKNPKEIALFLPNGYIERSGKDYRMTVTTRACYAPKLYSALQALDLVSQWISNFDEAKELLAWYLGLRGQPLWASRAWNIMFLESTFNPDANVETTSVDGIAARVSVDEPFATIRAGVGNYAVDSNASDTFHDIFSSATTNQYQTFVRAYLLFDSSALTANATISAGNIQVYAASKTDNFNEAMVSTVSSPASNVSIVASDYQNWVMTETASNRLDLTDITTSAYNTWTLNATGLTQISKTSISKFGQVSLADFTNTAPTWASATLATVNIQFAEGTNKPKLVVTYTLPAVAGGYPVLFSGGFVEF